MDVELNQWERWICRSICNIRKSDLNSLESQLLSAKTTNHYPYELFGTSRPEYPRIGTTIILNSIPRCTT
jgi:hypothetical protein